MIILPIYVKVNPFIEREMLFQFGRSCHHRTEVDIRRACRWLAGKVMCSATSWQHVLLEAEAGFSTPKGIC